MKAKLSAHSESIDCYAVLLPRKKGGQFYASREGFPATFYRRPDAIAFRDDLATHGLPKGTVVKIRLQIEGNQ